ncbi:MAG: hypothetical protein ACLTDV_06025 [Eubacterium sp.]
MDRQREEFGILYDALMASYDLDDKNEIRGFFNQLRQEFLDWHGTEFESPEFYAQEKKISVILQIKSCQVSRKDVSVQKVYTKIESIVGNVVTVRSVTGCRLGDLAL